MNEKLNNVITGTVSMLTIALCVMTIIYVAIALSNQKHFSPRTIFAHWVLFTGVAFVLFSIIYSAFGVWFFTTNGFRKEDIYLLTLYNSFMRGIGISFVFIWFLFFEAIDGVAHWIDRKLTHKKEII